MKVTVIDLPDGNKYGFPRILPEWVDSNNFDEWLNRFGYISTDKTLFRTWTKEVNISELPIDYYERNINETMGNFR